MFLRKLFGVAWISLFAVSCASTEITPTVQNNPAIPSPTTEVSTTIPPTPVETPGDIGCYRPYSATSIWNVPIDWTRARIHPDNESMMKAFFKDYDWIGSDTSQYSANLYFVTSKTPLVQVQLEPGRSFRNAIDDIVVQFGEQGGVVSVPLPPEAQPAPGTDGELVVINLDTGEEWGLINGVTYRPEDWTAGGVYLYSIHNSGVPPKGFAQRGAGIGGFAGLVRPCEVERGYIGHAVTLAYDFPCSSDVCQSNGWPEVIPPFTKSDGKGFEKYDIPEGARLVIRPEITADEIKRACGGVKGCVVWAEAMQIYGGFIVDDSGHPKTYAEGDATAHWDRRIWSEEMLKNIPKEWYVVLDWNN